MLNALAQRDIANCQAVVAHALALGFTDLVQLQALLTAESDRYRAGRAYAASLVAGGGVDYPVCPSCGRAKLRPGTVVEGMHRLGCPACRYSLIVED